MYLLIPSSKESVEDWKGSSEVWEGITFEMVQNLIIGGWKCLGEQIDKMMDIFALSDVALEKFSNFVSLYFFILSITLHIFWESIENCTTSWTEISKSA